MHPMDLGPHCTQWPHKRKGIANLGAWSCTLEGGQWARWGGRSTTLGWNTTHPEHNRQCRRKNIDDTDRRSAHPVGVVTKQRHPPGHAGPGQYRKHSQGSVQRGWNSGPQAFRCPCRESSQWQRRWESDTSKHEKQQHAPHWVYTAQLAEAEEEEEEWQTVCSSRRHGLQEKIESMSSLARRGSTIEHPVGGAAAGRGPP